LAGLATGADAVRLVRQGDVKDTALQAFGFACGTGIRLGHNISPFFQSGKNLTQPFLIVNLGDHLLNLHFSGKYFIVLFPRATVDIGDEVFRQHQKRGAAEGTPIGEVIEAALRFYHGQNGIDDRRF
jgi:hypothetical protein